MRILRNRPRIVSGYDYTNLSEHKQDESSFELWAALLAKIPLVRNENNKVNFKETLVQFKEPIYHPSLGHVDYKTIKSFLRGFATTNFSDIVESKMKLGIFNQAVPLILYAHKQYNNVPYEDWWDGDMFVQNALGKYLQWVPKMRLELEFDTTFEKCADKNFSFEEVRAVAATDKYDIRHPYTSYKCNKVGTATFDVLDSGARRMLLQLWIWNAAKRNKWMILNWSNWDDMPEAVDVIESSPASAFTKEEEAVWN